MFPSDSIKSLFVSCYEIFVSYYEVFVSCYEIFVATQALMTQVQQIYLKLARENFFEITISNCHLELFNRFFFIGFFRCSITSALSFLRFLYTIVDPIFSCTQYIVYTPSVTKGVEFMYMNKIINDRKERTSHSNFQTILTQQRILSNITFLLIQRSCP